MSMNNNKKDFEQLIEEVKDMLEDTSDFDTTDFIEVVTALVNEYDVHYRHDIEDIMYENGDLKGKINDADL